MTVQRMHEAENAIQEIGTNAIPVFLAWMDEKAPPDRSKTELKAWKLLPRWVINSPPVRRFLDDLEYDKRWPAAMAFRHLGATAVPAIHELEIRAQAHSGEKSDRALYALSCIGAPAVPSMARIFSNPERMYETWTMASVINLGTNARPLIPLLLSYLDHTNALTASFCAYMLCQLRLEPDVVVPALTRKLKDPRDNVRLQVSRSLGNFKFLASPALPELTNALSDPDALVQLNATNAIAIITGGAPPHPIAGAAGGSE
jgi:HEAT repeat protein